MLKVSFYILLVLIFIPLISIATFCLLIFDFLAEGMRKTMEGLVNIFLKLTGWTESSAAD